MPPLLCFFSPNVGPHGLLVKPYRADTVTSRPKVEPGVVSVPPQLLSIYPYRRIPLQEPHTAARAHDGTAEPLRVSPPEAVAYQWS
jgi:hypothetical protein